MRLSLRTPPAAWRRALILPAFCLACSVWAVDGPTGASEANPEESDTAPNPAPAESAAPPAAAFSGEPFRAYVVPMRDMIGKPTVYALRSGIKEANALKADALVIDMNTPGGELGSTLEIMKLLDRFAGKTVTYVNEDAVSAGAIIAAVTDEIHLAPRATIGSAEPVSGSGQDIDESMKRKVVSYVTAKVQAYTEDYPYRAEALTAMIDPTKELVIDGETISEEGSLLNLTATQAMKEYGDPPRPLLGSGIHESLDALLGSLAGSRPLEREAFEITWSLELATWLMKINPLLLGLGGLLLYIEFKTPGFGIFGIAGLIFIGIVFFGHHVAGLSGYEPLLVFILGACLVFIEVVFFPGVLVFAVPGALLMLGSLLWGMADIWPAETPGYELTADLFVGPLYNILFGCLLAAVFIAALLRFTPKSFVWDRLVLASSVGGAPPPPEEETGAEAAGAGAASEPRPGEPQTGAIAVAATDLYPTGEIEYEGRRFDAHLEVGTANRGDRVRVVRRSSFGYIVEVAEQ